jgi:hypothetical protein
MLGKGWARMANHTSSRTCVCSCGHRKRELRGVGRETSMMFSCSPDAYSQMGGAMAPPMKDLPRWLEENPEFAVAPDWTDIVKQSVSTQKRCT